MPCTRQVYPRWFFACLLALLTLLPLFRKSTVLQLSAPVKIFGDLHGQFGDLMRLFSEYGSPSTAGDIAYIDYLFLGDYVDRGAHSLETIALLLALKVRPPPPACAARPLMLMCCLAD